LPPAAPTATKRNAATLARSVSELALLSPGTVTVEACAAIDPIAREWDALVCRTGHPPFLRAGWFAAWWRAFAAGAPLVLTARRERMVGVLALRRRVGALCSPANVHTPGYGIVAEDRDAARALTAAMYATRPRAVALDHLSVADPGLTDLCAAAGAAGHRVQIRQVRRSPYATTQPGVDVDSRLGHKRAHDLRRLERRLAAAGRVEVEVRDGREALEALLVEGFRLEGSGWKSARGTAIASSATTVRFYTDIARWAAAEGLLRLAFLRVGGRGVAFHFALQDTTGYYLLKAGYDPVYRHCAPGRLLMRAMLAEAIAQRVPRFDLLGGDDPWKREWAREHCERVWLRTFASTPLGTVDRALHTAVLHARPVARRTLGRPG
jgi:CelD/BcsL family acetyltransferase involved in cellulose biosynthesis